MSEDGSSKRAKKVEQVRKMLDRAASTNHEAERLSCEAKAMKLMAEWDIEERELADAGSTDFDTHTVQLDDWGTARHGVAAFWAGLCEMHGALMLVSELVDIGPDVMWLGMVTATDSQWARIELLADHLLDQLRVSLVASPFVDRLSYSVGWAAVVVARLKAAQAEAYAEIGTALVPTTHAAEEAAREQIGDWGDRTMGPGAASDPESTRLAMLAAFSADLGQQRLGAPDVEG